MNIRFHRLFGKRYQKLPLTLQQKVDAAIRLFARDPRASQLRNHALTGVLIGKRAFSVTGDIRVIFEMIDDYAVVLLVDVGAHSQLFG